MRSGKRSVAMPLLDIFFRPQGKKGHLFVMVVFSTFFNWCFCCVNKACYRPCPSSLLCPSSIFFSIARSVLLPLSSPPLPPLLCLLPHSCILHPEILVACLLTSPYLPLPLPRYSCFDFLTFSEKRTRCSAQQLRS